MYLHMYIEPRYKNICLRECLSDLAQHLSDMAKKKARKVKFYIKAKTVDCLITINANNARWTVLTTVFHAKYIVHCLP